MIDLTPNVTPERGYILSSGRYSLTFKGVLLAHISTVDRAQQQEGAYSEIRIYSGNDGSFYGHNIRHRPHKAHLNNGRFANEYLHPYAPPGEVPKPARTLEELKIEMVKSTGGRCPSYWSTAFQIAETRYLERNLIEG